MSLPPLILLILWLAWVTQAVVCALRVRAFHNLLAREPSPEDRAYRPHATVIVPVKGIDPGLSETVASLLDQDYPSYQVVFVTESTDDPGYRAVKKIVVLVQ